MNAADIDVSSRKSTIYSCMSFLIFLLNFLGHSINFSVRFFSYHFSSYFCLLLIFIFCIYNPLNHTSYNCV